jgi:hypothetical protein
VAQVFARALFKLHPATGNAVTPAKQIARSIVSIISSSDSGILQHAVSNFRQANVQTMGIVNDEYADADFIYLSISWSAHLVLLG